MPKDTTEPIDLPQGGYVEILLTDGGIGDDDGQANGTIVDPGGIVRVDTAAIEEDETAPTVEVLGYDPAPNAAGWHTGDVTVTWRAVDDVSGATQPAPTTVTGEGTDILVESGEACDDAGNCATGTTTVSIDRTLPTITPTLTPSENAAGWHNTPVTIDWECDDTGSRLAACQVDETITTEGAGQSRTGLAQDVAGNWASASVSVDIDLTPPLVTCPAGGPFERGSSVLLSPTVFDDLSGPGASPAVWLDTSVARFVTVDLTGVDLAGNTATTPCTYEVVVSDEEPPVVTISGPEDGATYVAGTVPPAVCTTTDDDSGVAIDAELLITGLNGDGVGAATATCSGGTDVAGNVADDVSVGYRVVYATEPGFFTGGQVDLGAIHVGRRGRTYSMEWQLRNDVGELVTDLSAVATVTQETGWCAALFGLPSGSTAVPAPGTLSITDDGSFRFAWRAPRTVGCHSLEIALVDGTTVDVLFILLW